MQSPSLVYIFGHKTPCYIVKTISEASDPEKVPASATIGTFVLATTDGKLYMKGFDGSFPEVPITGGGGGSTGMYLGTVTNGGSFPTERPDHSELESGDFVKASPSSSFPFNIGTVTFSRSSDKGVFDGSEWLLEPGDYQDTDETPLSNPTSESFYGDRTTQNQVNSDVTTFFKDLFAGTTYTDLDTLEEEEILNRIYEQTTDTASRTAGYYIYDFSNSSWIKFGSGDIPNGNTLPSGKFSGELFILNVDVEQASGVVPKGLYKFNGSVWELVANATAVMISATGSTTINGYEVPTLTDSQIVQAYDSYISGHIVSIEDTHKYHNMAVVEVSNLTGKAVKILYRDVMIIEYIVGGTINYKTLITGEDSYSSLHTTHKTIIEAINEVADIESFKFKGYVSTSAPTEAKNGELWFNSATMPTTFPIAVKTYNGTSWSEDTTNYTPNSLDMWADLIDNHGYYWFGNTWNLIDVDVSYDNVSIDKNASGQLQVKSKVNNKPLSDGDIELKASDIKANNNQTIQANLERIDDDVAERQVTIEIDEYPTTLTDTFLYRVDEPFTHSGKTYGKGLYQVIGGELVIIAPTEEVKVDGSSIDFNSDGELEIKYHGITIGKLDPDMIATAFSGTPSDEKFPTEKMLKTNIDGLVTSISDEATARAAADTELLTSINARQRTILYGTSAPSASLGQDGDVYIQYES